MDVQQPKGVRDFAPEEKILRDYVTDTLRRIFERFGFNPLETPLLERYDVLSAKYAGGAEILKETFRLTDQGGRELGLRYDLTVPLARFVATNPNVKLPFKRYAIGAVYRDGPIKLGRYREFYQCDCDIVGANSPAADAQVLQLGLAVFDELKLAVTTTINSVALLRAMLLADGCPADNVTQAMLILDKLKKIGEEQVIAELETAGIPGNAVHKIIAIAQLATNEEKTVAIRQTYGAIAELTRVEQVLQLANDTRVVFDPALSRGLSYYTGIVFETYMNEGPITSSISAGGRYDKMIGEFVGRPHDYPAVGISFGLEPITEVLKLAAKKLRSSVTQVYVIPIKTIAESYRLTEQLRQAGCNADTDLLDRGISKNLDYASSLGIPFVIFVGKQELDAGKYKLRDMQSGSEELLAFDQIITRLQK